MTLLYRLTASEPPFGARTIWTTNPEAVAVLAAFESGQRSPAGHLYRVEADLSLEAPLDVADEWERVGDTRTLDEFMRWAQLHAAANCQWAQLLDHDERSWMGAHAELYLGDAPLPTELVVCCKVCDVEAPADVVTAFAQQLRERSAGGVLEASTWLGRVGGAKWGATTLYTCPEHRVPSGLLS